ncbi:DUF7344 domain-containing protein [Haladaptatus caseinilyticus]|uniref:DUF7344 domain-containing protein n=1 Tax=Haladaptatus caseinilyticus TaxID=2993314 RepID=UPI00224AF5F2|nr:ArsR family transcriptional regulator [Haladaptatus caseinilyticus]
MDTELTVDQIFDALGHTHRRHAISALLDCRDGTTIAELAEKTGRRADANPGRIETGLHHSHLPRLEGMGVVEYDIDAGTVTLTDAATDLEPFVELAEE